MKTPILLVVFSRLRSVVEPDIEELLPREWTGEETTWWNKPRGVVDGPDGDACLTGGKITVGRCGWGRPPRRSRLLRQGSEERLPLRGLCRTVPRKEHRRCGARAPIHLADVLRVGVSEPLSLYVDTDGTGTVEEAQIGKAVHEVMDLTPRGIRTHLWRSPIYQRTASCGYFGRQPEADGGFSWERIGLPGALETGVRVACRACDTGSSGQGRASQREKWRREF